MLKSGWSQLWKGIMYAGNWPNSGCAHFSNRCTCDNFKKVLFVCAVLDTFCTKTRISMASVKGLLWVWRLLVYKHMDSSTWAPCLTPQWVSHLPFPGIIQSWCFPNIIIETPFSFTHLGIQTMPFYSTFLVQKDVLFRLCTSWLIPWKKRLFSHKMWKLIACVIEFKSYTETRQYSAKACFQEWHPLLKWKQRQWESILLVTGHTSSE